jgi:hypothetical protein
MSSFSIVEAGFDISIHILDLGLFQRFKYIFFFNTAIEINPISQIPSFTDTRNCFNHMLVLGLKKDFEKGEEIHFRIWHSHAVPWLKFENACKRRLHSPRQRKN